MFGSNYKLNDLGLYSLHDMVEEVLYETEIKLKELPPNNTEDIAQLSSKIAYYKHELLKFEQDINEQRKDYFQFSIEKLFNGFGQYDDYITIEFHKFSESAKKYGRTIGGRFKYLKSERRDLELLITSDTISRTNGFIKVQVSFDSPITDVYVKELSEVGFKSGDIYLIQCSDSIPHNAYLQKGKKQIPNAINVSIDLTNSPSVCKLALYNLNQRIDAGKILIANEWNEYYGYNLYYSPEIKKIQSVKDEIYDTEGGLKKEVRFYELKAKGKNSDITEKELAEFSALLNERKTERFEVLKNELKKNNINSLEKFKEKHPNIFKEIYKVSLVFDDDVLTPLKSAVPVYWDFKSYLHIFLRHCEELQPEGPFKSKTPFVYSQKNIRRLLSIAIDELDEKIQDRLCQKLDFRIYDEKSLYLNGNYYSLRIESNGRVDSFYPLNKSEL
jgi:hypothetical protein